MGEFEIGEILLETGFEMKRTRKNNKGFTLVELIIVIAIIAILAVIIAPSYMKYVTKSRISRDLQTAGEIAEAFQVAIASDETAYQQYVKWGRNNIKRHLSVTVDGVTEKYDVYLIVANDKTYNYNFYGTEPFLKDQNGKPGVYTVLNETLGLSTKDDNRWINPKYTMNGKVVNWRLCKRVDNGQLEVWAADGGRMGGQPVYRVWPTADDVYR